VALTMLSIPDWLFTRFADRLPVIPLGELEARWLWARPGACYRPITGR
jgi:hypothetical protein